MTKNPYLSKLLKRLIAFLFYYIRAIKKILQKIENHHKRFIQGGDKIQTHKHRLHVQQLKKKKNPCNLTSNILFSHDAVQYVSLFQHGATI